SKEEPQTPTAAPILTPEPVAPSVENTKAVTTQDCASAACTAQNPPPALPQQMAAEQTLPPEIRQTSSSEHAVLPPTPAAQKQEIVAPSPSVAELPMTADDAIEGLLSARKKLQQLRALVQQGVEQLDSLSPHKKAPPPVNTSAPPAFEQKTTNSQEAASSALSALANQTPQNTPTDFDPAALQAYADYDSAGSELEPVNDYFEQDIEPHVQGDGVIAENSAAEKNSAQEKKALHDTTAQKKNVAVSSNDAASLLAKPAPQPVVPTCSADEQNAASFAHEEADENEALETHEDAERAFYDHDYRWQASMPPEQTESALSAAQIKSTLQNERTPEMQRQLELEACEQDFWSRCVAQLPISKLLKQLVLNAAMERKEDIVHLYLRPSQAHLQTPSNIKILTQALSEHLAAAITLQIEINDEQGVTPLEWRDKIYADKLAQAKQSLHTDPFVILAQQRFGAALDETSIRPL
ncbi:MAG: DNA polymerase III subunit gamma/tau C-terminal domain-containing protein, partial [Enterovibrio sp.]